MTIKTKHTEKDYSELAKILLEKRGIKTAIEAETFLNPSYEDNHNPFLMNGMEEAIARIYLAIKNKEKIIIYSDYDADGIPGAVVLYDFFKKIGYENFENYIPHRILEGFGLNDEAIEEFAKNDAKLIITVDCGISDVEESKKIKKLGIDLIVSDHHLPKISENGEEELPEAIAVLDHKILNSNYPDKNICGAGIAFKIVQAFLQKHAKEFNVNEGWEKWLLDMVGIATISDMVPLVGENRIFAKFGLRVLQKSRRPGLSKLCYLTSIDQKNITEDDISFMITPRINAASRMGEPEDAFFMLSTEDEKKASDYAVHLDKINSERKVIVAGMVKEAKKHWEKIDPEKKRKVFVAGNPDWKPSLLGLVANAILEVHEGPVFLWGREGGRDLKGSCRSDGCVNIVEMMRDSSSYLLEYGGHAMSGGFVVDFSKIEILKDGLESSYEKLKITEEKKEFSADLKISIDDVNEKTEEEISKFAPFGMGNPKPVFLFEKVLIDSVSIFGKKNDHTKIIFKNSLGKKVSSIAFFKKPEDFEIKPIAGEKINLLGNIEKSFWGGRKEIRLRILEIF